MKKTKKSLFLTGFLRFYIVNDELIFNNSIIRASAGAGAAANA